MGRFERVPLLSINVLPLVFIRETEMPYVKKADMLTGGTGDVSPQLYSMTVIQAQANTFVEQAFPNPVPRYSSSKDKAIVLEALKAYFYLPKLNALDIGNEAVFAQLSTISLTGYSPGGPTVFAAAELDHITYYEVLSPAVNSTVAFDSNELPIVVDMTDGAGHGVLIATDQIFFGWGTLRYDANINGTAAVIKLLYRFKEVPLAEYIGIVQSQQ